MRCWSWRGDRRLLIPILLAVALPASPALAQSPADRAALAAFADSLAAIESPDALRALADAGPRPRTRAIARLRKGLIDLALARKIGGRKLLDDALMEFDWAVTLEPSWPWPRLGRAMAKLELSDGDFTEKFVAGLPWGVNYYQGFVADMVAAFARDPGFDAGVRYLVSELPAQGDRTQPRAFVRALTVAARDSSAPPDLRLVLGRAYRTEGQLEAALAEFAAYLRTGGDSGLALIERARTLADGGRLKDAAGTYLRGAVLGDRVARSVYRRDLAWIAGDAELAAYDALPADSLGPWITRFWERRDAESVRPRGERLQDHLRRWAYAHRHFRVRSPERKTDFRRVTLADIAPCMPGGAKSPDDLTFQDPARLDDARRRERLLDHRGVIYIRHGEPARIINRLNFLPPMDQRTARRDVAAEGGSDADGSPAAFDPVAPPAGRMQEDFGAEVWQYWFGGESRILYFSGSDALGPGPTSLYPYVPFTASLLYQVAAIDSRYRAVADAAEREADGRRSRHAPPLACMKAVQQVRRDSRRAMLESVESDSHTLLFGAPLDARILTFAVGDAAAGRGRVLVTFAAPGRRLVAYPRPDGEPGVLYPVTVRVTAVDSAGRVAFNADSTRTFFTSDTLRGNAHLTGVIGIPLPAGRVNVRVAVFQPEGRAGAVIERRGVRLAAAGLALTDIVTGAERGGVAWTSAGDAVEINALDEYDAGSTAPIYYEVYGLEPGRTYRTTVTVQRGTEAAGRAVRLVFDERATAPSARMRRDVGLGQLARGQYRLTVTVEDPATGRSVTRERMINLLGPAPAPRRR